MSKFVSMKVKIVNLDVAKKCIEGMGFTVSDTIKEIRGFEGVRKVDVSIQGIHSHRGYGIGLVREKDGSYSLIADRFDRDVAKIADALAISYKEAEAMRVLKHKATFVKKREQVSERMVKLYIPL